LPSDLIEISLPGTFIALVYLLSTIFTFWIIAEILNPLWSKLPDPIRKRLRFYVGFVVIIIVYILIAGKNILNLKLFLIIFGFMLFLDFILPALSFRDKRSYTEKIKHNHEKSLQYDTVLDKIAARVGVNWIMIIMIIILALTFSYYSGIGYANRKIEYMVFVDRNDEVILRQYGDKIISASIDRNAKK
jgi:magnesium-transporting ATPase (P-type)